MKLLTTSEDCYSSLECIAQDLRDPGRSHVILAMADNPILQQEVAGRLAERFTGDYAFHEFDFASTLQASLPRFCRSLREDLPICLFAYGLERLKQADEERYQEALGLLNNHREDIRDTGVSLVLWLTSETHHDVLANAPDFADWRSTDVVFDVSRHTPVEETALGRLPVGEAEDLRRKARVYEEMLSRTGLEPALAIEFRKQLGSIRTRLGLAEQPSRMASPLVALLTLLRQMGVERVKQLPRCGTAMADFIRSTRDVGDAEAQREFGQRVDRLVAIGRQTREDIEALQALASFFFDQLGDPELLQQRLSAAGLTSRLDDLKEWALNVALIAYRSRLAADYQYVDYRGLEGLVRADHAASLPLDEVFVSPRLLELGTVECSLREQQLMKTFVEGGTKADPVALEREFAEVTGRRWCANKDRGMDAQEALTRHRHLVIVGGPGVGKSTLIRRVARECALGSADWGSEAVPLVLSLAAFADDRIRSNQMDMSLRTYVERHAAVCGGEPLRLAMARELEAGRVFLLLDGVDEVAEVSQRAAIVSAVEKLAEELPATRILVTSRTHGYVRVEANFHTLEMAHFNEDQKRDFVSKWERAFERWRHPESPDLVRAAKEASDLLEEIRGNPKVDELAANPLMLVIISLIRFEQARLPEQRVQLYNRAVCTLMDTWNYWRSLQPVEAGGAHLPLDRLIRVWGAVAEWTRHNRPTGVIHRVELKRELVRILEEFEFDDDGAEATADSYLNAAANRAGLLEERGRDIFAFWHPTFEEYLAAVELATPTSRAVRRLLPLRDDPRWREVILLAVGYVGIVLRDNETATDLVEAIANEGPAPFEPILHSHLLLATTCVTDNVGVKRAAVQRLVVRLVEAVREQPYEPLIDAFRFTVDALPSLRPTPVLVASLATLVDHPAWRVRQGAARLLARAAREVPLARDLCERLLRDLDGDVRCFAAAGLVRMGDFRPTVLAALAYAENPVFLMFADGKEEALETLRTVRSTPATAPRFRDTLRDLLSSVDFEERLDAASQLIDMGDVDSQVRDAAISYALASEDAWMWWRATSFLQAMSGQDPEIEQRLMSMLTAVDVQSRLIASYVLAVDEREDVRTQVLSSVTALLEQENHIARLRCADELYGRGLADDSCRRATRECLLSSNPMVMSQALGVLARMRLGDDEEEALLKFVCEHDNLALVLAEHFQAVGARLRGLLESPAPDNWMRSEKRRVVAGLRSLLTADDLQVRLHAADLLWNRKGTGSEEIDNAVRTCLSEGSAPIADAAADLFMAMGEPQEAVEGMLAHVAPHASDAATACRAALKGEALPDNAGHCLAELTRRLEGDTEMQATSREWLFNWLHRTLTVREGHSAGNRA